MTNLDGEIRGGRHLMQVRVYYEDTDFSQSVYHASFLRFMERGRTNYLRLLGAGQRALFEETLQAAGKIGAKAGQIVVAKLIDDDRQKQLGGSFLLSGSRRAGLSKGIGTQPEQ